MDSEMTRTELLGKMVMSDRILNYYKELSEYYEDSKEGQLYKKNAEREQLRLDTLTEEYERRFGQQNQL